MFTIVRDIFKLQKGYKQLAGKKELTKQAMCDLVVPFRDKYHLKDLEAISIAKGELSIESTLNLVEKSIGATYSIRQWLVQRPKNNVIVTILENKSDNTYSFVNLTAGHICTCRFASVDDALADMEKKRAQGDVIEYYEL